jgi:hypothetical protein
MLRTISTRAVPIIAILLLARAQFSFKNFYKRKVDSSSHQIFRRMHETLNIDKK